MTRIILLLVISGMSLSGNAQKLKFNYDNSGNQIVRELCLSNCSSMDKKGEVKEVTVLKEEDLLKFSAEDALSYYPNPVKEELYLRWQLNEQNSVSSIRIYNFNGQLLETLQGIQSMNSQNLSFRSYPTGVYLVILVYNDGTQKDIKIIKQ